MENIIANSKNEYKKQYRERCRCKFCCRVQKNLKENNYDVKYEEEGVWKNEKGCKICSEKSNKLYNKKFKYRSINDLDMSKILCFDIETTGLNEDDEILQISIIDGNGKKLFDEYIKPKIKKEWAEAEAINGISYEFVENEKNIEFYIKQLNDIFRKAELVVGYNIENFDIPFLRRNKINIKNEVFDVMLEFAPIYKEWSSKYNCYKWQRLEICANYYGYKNFIAHDSLTDTKATLYCFKKMIKERKENRI